MNRLDANIEILKILIKEVKNNPDCRFGQILANTKVITYNDSEDNIFPIHIIVDPFYEESTKMLERIKGK